MKKTVRLIFPLITLFFSTAVCSIGYSDEAQEENVVAERQQATELSGLRTGTALAAGNFALQPPTSTATPIPVIPTDTFTPVPVPLSILPSGSYQVDVLTGGKEYRSTWTLEVVGETVTGSSAWDCCPSARTDEMSGTFIGEELTLERDCSGQGFEGPCTQTYKGTIKGNTIAGTITGTGIPPSGATWTLYLGP